MRSTNSHRPERLPEPLPGPFCAVYAPLLPVLDEPATQPRLAAEVRAHAAACAYCRARSDEYTRLDAALRRAFTPDALPAPRTEEIMRRLNDSESAPVATPAPPAPISEPSVTLAPLDYRRPPRRAVTALAALAAALVVALLAQLIFSAHPHGPSVAAGQTPTPGTTILARGEETLLNDVSMVSPTEGWAVGQHTDAPHGDAQGSAPRGVIYHDLNGRWRQVDGIPNTIGALAVIQMLSASDGWAAGQGAILRYDGHTWREQAAIPDDMIGLRMLSPTDGWAIAETIDPYSFTGIYHFDGAQWKPAPLSAELRSLAQKGIGLRAIQVRTADEGWIVGQVEGDSTTIQTGPNSSSSYPSTPPTGILLHLSEGQWTVQATFPNTTLSDIAMTSAGDGWAVGYDHTYRFQSDDPAPFDSTHMLLLRSSAGRWQRVAVPLADPTRLSGTLSHIVMRSPDDGWITGASNGGVSSSVGDAPQTAVLLHYTGGRWIETPPPVIANRFHYSVSGLAVVAAGDVWAVGISILPREDGIANLNGSFMPTVVPLILHYHDGVWSVVTS
jgi:hypothetical protein